ncbi:hypothetical protein [Methanolacinia paynteri]|uniref:hypothetical protein n=1 Tax=Methanolacinia paynteri TaxID=230356 RepID=UPI00064F4D26|nr:hypothetical protein [Methanolacinia paynteri]
MLTHPEYYWESDETPGKKAMISKIARTDLFDNRRIGGVSKSKSGLAVNIRRDDRMFTAKWADLVRVVEEGGKAVISEVE